MHALASPGQDVVGHGRLSRRLARRRQRRLQGANGILEGEAVRLQDLGGDASRVSNDGGEYDGAVDVPPAASARSGCGGLQNAPHFDRNAKRIMRSRLRTYAFQNAGNHVSLDALAADVAGIEHGQSIGVVAEGREQMLKRDLSRAHRSGELGAASQRRGEFRRHGDLRNIWCRYAHDISRKKAKTGKTGQDSLRQRVENTRGWQGYSNGTGVGRRRIPFIPKCQRSTCVRTARPVPESGNPLRPSAEGL